MAVTAGTTNGAAYVDHAEVAVDSVTVRIWTTNDAATAFITFMNTFILI